jgi:hypothetical protein
MGGNLEEEFAPFGDDTGVVAQTVSLRRRRVESARQGEGLSPTLRSGDASRFESLLALSFGEGLSLSFGGGA